MAEPPMFIVNESASAPGCPFVQVYVLGVRPRLAKAWPLDVEDSAEPEARRQSADPTEGNMPNTSRFIRLSTGLGRIATGTLRGRRSCRLRNRML
jgi:hypothetical protein